MVVWGLILVEEVVRWTDEVMMILLVGSVIWVELVGGILLESSNYLMMFQICWWGPSATQCY